MDEPLNAPAHAPAMLLPVSEAAPRLGISPIALRSRIRRGSITARRGNAGQLLVEVPAYVPAQASAFAATHAGTGAGAEPLSVVDELQAEIDALRHELSEARAQREAATAIAGAKVEAAERLIEELRNALARETALLLAERDRLAAELAEARKGWLERLLEAIRRRS